MSLKLPQGQKLLTNVSVVRMKKGKEKYEMATYPNTIIAWRTGAEVLQIYLLKQAPHCEPGKGV